MNVSLTPRLEAMIRQKVESGLYNNASEVVREALRLMESRETDERLRAALAVGQEQLDRGERVIYTPELREEIFQTAIQMANEGIKPKADVIPKDDHRPIARSQGRPRSYRPAEPPHLG